MLAESFFAAAQAPHTLNGTKLTLTLSGRPPFMVNIRADDRIGAPGGFYWIITTKKSVTVDLAKARSTRFYYGIKSSDKTKWDINSFEINKATCFDRKQNQGETDIDCGSGCIKCGLGKSCISKSDCESNFCLNTKCAPALCPGTDNSCGLSSCTDCNQKDSCEMDHFIDYSCRGGDCVSAKDDCKDCSCSCGGYNLQESAANGNCKDGKDDDCDGSIDTDPECKKSSQCTACQESPLKVYPSYNIRAGEEALFNAFSYLKSDPSLTRFDWDFGDTYSLKYPEGGVSVTHTYMYPGKYNVTITMTNLQGTITKAIVPISVEGIPARISTISLLNPIIRMNFDGSLNEASGILTSYQGSQKYTYGPVYRGFDLGGSFVRIQNKPTTLNKFTISFFARQKDLTKGGVVLDAGSLALAYVSEWRLSLDVKTDKGNCALLSNWETLSHNTDWNHYAIIYDGSKLKLYINGKEPVQAASCAGNVELGNIVLGASKSGNNIFNAEIDEFEIVQEALDIEEVLYGFELEHANFHARTAQYITANIPDELISKSASRLVVKISSNKGYESIVYDKRGLSKKERFLLKNGELKAGSYTLGAQLLDSSNNMIAEIKEYFDKPYDGIPQVGIDENNAIRVNGELFFPVTPWGLNDMDFPKWLGKDKAINSLYGTAFWHGGGFGATKNLQSWKYYLDEAKKYNTLVLGPSGWDGLKGKVTSLDNLMEYVNATKDSNILAWQWMDEPELGGYEAVSSQALRSWTLASHLGDPQHPVATNFAGPGWIAEGDVWDRAHRRKYEYLYDASLFGGKKTPVADILGFDFYPIDWALPHQRGATVTQLAEIMDKIRQENADLAPVFSWIETSDINEPPYSTQWPPTPEQVRMLAWLNVVHGAKGINWFHYHLPSPNGNFVAMRKFVSQITHLAPIVLSGDSVITISDTANVPGNRVDTMVKRNGTDIWLFAVRLTETSPKGGTGETKDIKTTFSIPALREGIADVYDEGRQLKVYDGKFTDNFKPNDMHIYKIRS